MNFIRCCVGIRDGNDDCRLTGSLLDLDAVCIPADRICTAVFAIDGRTEVDGRSQNGLFAGDFQGKRRKNSGHIHIVGEIRILAGLAGHAIAPFDENVIFCRNCRDGQRLGRVGDGVLEAGLSGIFADAQGSAAGTVDFIGRFILFLVIFFALTTCAGRSGLAAACGFGRAAGSLHRRARV